MSILSGILASSTLWARVRSDEMRERFLPAVWSMYETVYSKLGSLNIGEPSFLLEFDDWHLRLDSDLRLTAFALSRMTAFGEKVGAMAPDDSGAAKVAVKEYFRDLMRTEGYWAEASGATLAIARRMKLPMVCPEHATELLPGKTISPGSTPASYTRTITGVGPVEKVLIGRPVGFPVVFSERQCAGGKLGAVPRRKGKRAGDDDARFDMIENLLTVVF